MKYKQAHLISFKDHIALVAFCLFPNGAFGLCAMNNPSYACILGGLSIFTGLALSWAVVQDSFKIDNDRYS